jgi:uncharacterized protein (DUF2249 family)/hemerythrin-like domain-containing protein
MVPPRAGERQAPASSRATAVAAPHGGTGERHSLADEHAVLFDEVRYRNHAVLSALGEGRWPDQELEALVDYLRYEVLDQAVTEERLLFPLTGDGLVDGRVHRLVTDHVRLRDLTDRLADARRTRPDPAVLVDTLDTVVRFLDRHMREEEGALATVTAAGVESLRQPFRCHLWFPVTEGHVLDLDALPHEFAHRAAVDRFLRLPPGEQIVVRSQHELDGLWNALTSRLPGEIGWVYLEEGPQRWQAEVTRRAPE